MNYFESKYSKKQWLILLIYGVIYFLYHSAHSLQFPFYPMIAEMKGVTPATIGIIFSIYKMIRKFQATSLSLSGVFITGITTVLFEFIDRINGVSLFLCVSVAIQVLEGLGVTLFKNVVISLITFEFSENVEMAFAFLQSVYTLGNILGPLIGGALLEVGGFVLPFSIFGVLLLFSAIPAAFLNTTYPKEGAKSLENILKLIPLPPDLSRGSSIILWSKLREKYDNAGIICFISSLLSLFGLILLGPAPYLPFGKSTYSLLIGLIINGSGIGGGDVGGYFLFHRGAKIANLPKTIQTYTLISSIARNECNIYLLNIKIIIFS
ncbi:MFS-type transporter SLC18B1 [Armadillidium vulgare]|nr:MFS-type transporter SLC18B1 [Armadillidium vulgare]